MPRPRILAALIGAALGLGALAPAIAAAPAPAQAAGVVSVPTAALKTIKGVTVKKIGTKYVGGSAKVKVAPSVTKKGTVKITKKTLTVKRGTKTIAKNKTSVRLPAGTYKVTTKVTYRTYKVIDGAKKYAAARTFQATQTLKVKHLSKTYAGSGGNCPSWAPVKGNMNSGIYHVPGGRYYAKTKANVMCYVSPGAAQRDGYRASKA